MKKQIPWLAFTIGIILSLAPFFNFDSSKISPSLSMLTAQASTSGQANWWDSIGEPKYGGTLTIRRSSISNDPHAPMGFNYAYGEPLFYYNWTTDRKEYPFNTEFVPLEYWVGVLAEDWKLTDPLTLTVKLRKGVHFHDRPPANGREMTADDVVCTYDRILGTGHGYTKPIPQAPAFADVEKATAKDKYTVAFTFKQPGFRSFFEILFSGETGMIIPDEVIKQGLGMDWKAAASTGPYIVSDYKKNVSMNFRRNPKYWGYDERHPQNKLPYIDEIQIIEIPDQSTTLAALRTGKVDWVDDRSMNWIQAKSLAKTNPDIQKVWIPNNGFCLDMKVSEPPLTDIRVRKALQMAINRKEIAKTHYGGFVSGNPVGLIAPETGWTTPFAEWPRNLKEEYTYNPASAKKLLAEAGYPKGFKTNVYASSDDDKELLMIIKSYFADINVDLDINMMAPPDFRDFGNAKKHDQMITNDLCGMIFPPMIVINLRTQGFPPNKTNNNDPKYEEIVKKIMNADAKEAKKISSEADMYVAAHHWSINICGTMYPLFYQSRVKGYIGERVSFSYYWARFWLDR